MEQSRTEPPKSAGEGKTDSDSAPGWKKGLPRIRKWKILGVRRPAVSADPRVRQEAIATGPDEVNVPAPDSQVESHSRRRATGQGWLPSPDAATKTDRQRGFPPQRRAKCHAGQVPYQLGYCPAPVFVPRRRCTTPADPPRPAPRFPTVSPTLGALRGMETIAPSDSARCMTARQTPPAYLDHPYIIVPTDRPIAIPATGHLYTPIGAAVVFAPSGLEW